MKQVRRAKRLGGTVAFRLGWPFFKIYFLIWSKRTRVLVLCGDELVLVKDWLGDGAWGLPGGGMHRRETLVQSALRELREETGIVSQPSRLEYLAEVPHDTDGLTYTAVYFVLRLQEKPPLVRQPREIAEIGWFPIDKLGAQRLNADARYAADHLLPSLV